MENLSYVLAKNIALFRRNAKLTQAELAEKLNFSDKSVSKWERGDGMPDLSVLMQMCEIFGVTLNDMVNENPVEVKPKNHTDRNHVLIALMSVVGVWLLATCAFVICMWTTEGSLAGWIGFLIAIPTSFVVLVIFASIWGSKWQLFGCVTALIWTTLMAICICAKVDWFVVLIGIPAQIIAVLAFLLKKVDGNWKISVKDMSNRVKEEKQES